MLTGLLVSNALIAVIGAFGALIVNVLSDRRPRPVNLLEIIKALAVCDGSIICAFFLSLGVSWIYMKVF